MTALTGRRLALLVLAVLLAAVAVAALETAHVALAHVWAMFHHGNPTGSVLAAMLRR